MIDTFPFLSLIVVKIHPKLNLLNMRLHNSVVLMHHLLIDRFVEHVYLCRSKLSRANLLLEQDIEFGKGAASRFREAEVDVDDATEANSTL